jgi:small redox-active disulfide protein 2
MKKIKILGVGCPKCQKLYDNAKAAADELGIEYDIEKVTDMGEMMQYGVMITPALVVDGEVKIAGKAPSPAELKALLAGNAR